MVESYLPQSSNVQPQVICRVHGCLVLTSRVHRLWTQPVFSSG